ncbi:MAG: hypothetical protein IJX92_06735 [Clostridia bacterium]|nr:hypothetical protein [Clostridia bacterium]
MIEYMKSVFIVSALFSLFTKLSYKSNLDGARRIGFGILFVFVVASPLFTMLGEISKTDIEKIFSDFESYEGAEYEVAELSLEQGILKCISSEFNIKEENLTVMVENFDISKMNADRVRVILSGAAITADYNKIENYVESLEIGECDVEIEIG